jgi:hypothetical protein
MGIYVLQIVDATPTSVRRRPAPKKAPPKVRPQELLRRAICIVADELAPVAQAEA